MVETTMPDRRGSGLTLLERLRIWAIERIAGRSIQVVANIEMRSAEDGGTIFIDGSRAGAILNNRFVGNGGTGIFISIRRAG